MTPFVARTRAELAAARAELDGRVGVVMTMGALHEGHLRLIETARKHADQVLVTIFVNPLQFGAGEDLDRYPRTLAADLEKCEAAGVDLVFAPSVEDIYPPGEPVETKFAGELGDRLEGAVRPTHFDGVLTVVAKLLELTRPDVSVFGEKDAQQLALIRRMVAQSGLPVEIVGAPIVREPDGLAMSSRNRYLDPTQRRTAVAFSQALESGASRAVHGPEAMRAAAHDVLDQVPEIELDYLVVVDDATWDNVTTTTRNARILVAGRVGKTRLIDNRFVVLGTQDSAG